MVAIAPADGGRRARRGFFYQDLVTLLDCLDMLSGMWTAVGWESLEDILCFNHDAPVYRQVKTIEGSSRHSIAQICHPEVQKSAASSILGKLFSGKPLPDGTRFTFIVNETPSGKLYEFVTERGKLRGPVSEEAHTEAASKLKNLALPDGRDVSWCIDRLDVLVEARTIDQLENHAYAQLVPFVRAYLGEEPLEREGRDVLERLLIKHVIRPAFDQVPKTLSDVQFREALEESIRHVTGHASDGSTERLTKLVDKLRAADIPAPLAQRQHESMLAFRRRLRSSVGVRRGQLNLLSDEVNAICMLYMAKRRSGQIDAGSDAYNATVMAVSELPDVASGVVSLADAMAVLSDITARCLNWYADVS